MVWYIGRSWGTTSVMLLLTKVPACKAVLIQTTWSQCSPHRLRSQSSPRLFSFQTPAIRALEFQPPRYKFRGFLYSVRFSGLCNDAELSKVLYSWLQFYYSGYTAGLANEETHRARSGGPNTGSFHDLRMHRPPGALMYDCQPVKLARQCPSVWVCQVCFSWLNWGCEDHSGKCHSSHLTSRIHNPHDLHGCWP